MPADAVPVYVAALRTRVEGLHSVTGCAADASVMAAKTAGVEPATPVHLHHAVTACICHF
jgi:hypothetical protein